MIREATADGTADGTGDGTPVGTAVGTAVGTDVGPIAVVEVELAGPIAALDIDRSGTPGATVARLFVRLHTALIGSVDVEVPCGSLTAQDVADALWVALGGQIADHLAKDALPAPVELTAEGLPTAADRAGGSGEVVACLRRRAEILRNAPAVSVIMCTRNRPDLLARSVQSIVDNDYPDFEVLVLDGSTTSETADLVRERFPEVTYRHVGDQNKCYALNRGIDLARSEFLAFTDDDARVDRHWIAELVQGFDDHRVGAVTGAALPMSLQTPAQVWYEESGGFTHGFEPRVIGLDVPADGPSLLPFATGKIGAGVNMAWRKSVLEEFGGFDLSLDTVTPLWPPGSKPGTAGEDLGAFFDALVRGWRIRFQPSAIAYHEHRRTYPELRRQIRWHSIALTAYLLRCLVRRPGQLVPFLLRLPRGLRYAFAHSSIRNNSKSGSFPAELTRVERLGTLHGPFAYLRGLPQARRVRAEDRAARTAARAAPRRDPAEAGTTRKRPVPETAP